jgi:hypothetical protein
MMDDYEDWCPELEDESEDFIDGYFTDWYSDCE